MVAAIVSFVKKGFLFLSSLHFKENEKSYQDGRGCISSIWQELDLPNLQAQILQDRLKMIADIVADCCALKTLQKSMLLNSRRNNEWGFGVFFVYSSAQIIVLYSGWWWYPAVPGYCCCFSYHFKPFGYWANWVWKSVVVPYCGLKQENHVQMLLQETCFLFPEELMIQQMWEDSMLTIMYGIESS